tara:strand:- start:10864 stop:11526 length:663 start_codon:yes stop_codon:yes gene_type:complete
MKATTPIKTTTYRSDCGITIHVCGDIVWSEQGDQPYPLHQLYEGDVPTPEHAEHAVIKAAQKGHLALQGATCKAWTDTSAARSTNKGQRCLAISRLTTELEAIDTRRDEITDRLNNHELSDEDRIVGETAAATNAGSRLATREALKSLKQHGTLEQLQTRILRLMFHGDAERTINNIGFRNSARGALIIAEGLSAKNTADHDEADAIAASGTPQRTRTER